MNKPLREFSSPQQMGDYAEFRVMTEFIKHGFDVLKPINSGLSYDFACFKDGKFLKVQVKCGTLAKNGGVLKFRLSRNFYNYYSDKEIDIFAVYSSQLDQIFIIDVNNRIWYLRLVKARNNQDNRVNYAKDYTLEGWVKNGAMESPKRSNRESKR